MVKDNAISPHPTLKVTLWFYSFIVLHITLWTLAPSFFRLNLPLDAMETTTWASHLAWGYDKNPFLNAWLTAASLQLAPTGILTYFLSQLSVVICFIATWTLAKKILSPLKALTAVMLLEGIQYYHLHSIDFSDNSLLLSMWALTILFFYQALQKNEIRHWIFTGFFAGFALMVKYFSGLLLLSMFFLLLKDYRHYFKKPAIYFGLLTFLMIITPHLIWLFSNDLITLHYAIARTTAKYHWYNHIVYPLQFTLEQCEALIPLLLLLLFFFPFKKNVNLQKYEKNFFIFVGILPFFLTLMISSIFAMKLRAAWGQPLFSLVGIILIINTDITLKKFYRFSFVLTILIIVTVSIYSANLLCAKKISTAIFPGKHIATFVTNLWENKYQTPLKFVAGGRWLAGNIALYSSDHPKVFIDWEKNKSPWIHAQELQQHGAIFVWDLTTLNRRKEASYEEIKARFPLLTPAETYYFPWQRHSILPQAAIKIAFLPPKMGDNLGDLT